MYRTRFVALSCMVFALLLSSAHAAEPASLETLTAEEAERLEKLRADVQSTPEVKAATEKWKAARKNFQLDRAKYPNDRDPNASKAYRLATKELESVIQAAMVAADPSAKTLLSKKQRTKNAGENETDSDDPRNLAVKPITDEPGLPRVLLIGDSISIGYTLKVRELLKGKANVHRIPVNGGATDVGLANMSKWLGDDRWDVIHFNFGLHDAKYASATEQRATREQYVANLKALAKQMQATGAKLIFATTTPIPRAELQPGRRFDSIEERNKLATAAMQEMGVAIDDLYAAVYPVREKVGRPNDVHFTPEGYAVLGGAVAASITQALAK